MYVIIYFELIVQVTMALHFGACLITILKDFIVTGENVFDVFGMFLEHTHCTFLYGGENIEIQVLSFFFGFYLSVMNSENHIVSICAYVCVTSLSVFARNRRMLIYKLIDDGQILVKPKYIVKKKLVSTCSNDKISSSIIVFNER